MNGDLARVYVDTNAFVVAFETTGDDSDAMKLLLNASLQGRVSLLTSELTLAEVLVVPERTGNVTLVRAYTQALTIHAVTAIRSGCSTFLANDKRIRLPSGMVRVPPLAPAINELLKQT